MTIQMDTSALIPAIVEAHPEHQRVLPHYERIVDGMTSGVLAAHTLAEAYSTITRMPLTLHIAPLTAWNIVEKAAQNFTVVALTEDEYRATLADLAARGIGGGAVYDALIAAVARKAQVDALLTFNTKHFLRVAPDLSERIQEP